MRQFCKQKIADMKAAFVVFNGVTSLDFVGAFDAIGRLRTMGFVPQLEWVVCGQQSPMTDDRGLTYLCDDTVATLEGFDLLVVPGGKATRKLMRNADFLAWLKTAAGAKIKASVCTGSLLLGAAGFLHGKTAATHPGAVDDLKPFCAKVSDQRVIQDGDVITSRGVTASIDLGLAICKILGGEEARNAIAKQMDYPFVSRAQF